MNNKKKLIKNIKMNEVSKKKVHQSDKKQK